MAVAIAMVAALQAAGQNEVVLEHDYTSFKGAEISGGFEVSVKKSDSYSVKLVVDELLETYTQAYVKDGILHIVLDSKSFPTELRKALKGRNAIVPVLKAEIYTPRLEELYVGNDVIVNCPDPLAATDLSLNLYANASVNTLSVNAKSVRLNASRTSSVRMSVQADTLTASASGTAWLNIDHDVKVLDLYAGGSSNVNFSGKTSAYSVSSDSSSKMLLKGTADSLNVNSKGTSSVYADSLAVNSASVCLTGSAKCRVAASSRLKVDLSGYSNLTFYGNPSVEVVRIISSTMTRAEETPAKKEQ